MTLRRQVVGRAPRGEEIVQIIAENSAGLSVSFLSYGATIQRVALPDRNGMERSVVLGFGDALRYLNPHPNYGVTVGRFANRIDRARFSLGGKEYSLDANDGKHSLHGGNAGFAKRHWQSELVGEGTSAGVAFRIESADGDGGYPGNLSLTVTYLVDEAGELSMEWRAESDAPTPVSITNHAYWNLSGDPTKQILDHEFMLPGSGVIPVDGESIPRGVIADVASHEGGRFDLRKWTLISERVVSPDTTYDNCYLVPGALPGDTSHHALSPVPGPGGLPLAARARCKDTGIMLELGTDMPGVQFYTGNKLAGKEEERVHSLPIHAAFCLEPEYFPDAPNQESFTTPIVEAGKPLVHKAVYSLVVE